MNSDKGNDLTIDENGGVVEPVVEPKQTCEWGTCDATADTEIHIITTTDKRVVESYCDACADMRIEELESKGYSLNDSNEWDEPENWRNEIPSEIVKPGDLAYEEE